MREREEEDEEEGVRVSESEKEREHVLDEGRARGSLRLACQSGRGCMGLSGVRAASCLHPSRSADVSDLNTSRGGCMVPAAHNTQARWLAHDSHTLHPHQREGGREEGGGRVDRVRQTNSEGR